MYGRSKDNQVAIIALNRGNEIKGLSLNLQGKLTNGVTVTDQLDPAYTISSAENTLNLTIPAMTGRMLTSTTK